MACIIIECCRDDVFKLASLRFPQQKANGISIGFLATKQKFVILPPDLFQGCCSIFAVI